MELRSPLGEDNKTIPRSREFLWQEGHTLHATYEEAEERTIRCGKFIRIAIKRQWLSIRSRKKGRTREIRGAEDTYTIEALMHDGKALQSATSHFFGNGFRMHSESNM